MPDKTVERCKPSYRSPHRLVDPPEQEHQGLEPDDVGPSPWGSFKQGATDAR